MRKWIYPAILGVLACTPAAAELDRQDFVDRAQEYCDIVWTVADTMSAWYDSRYASTTSCSHSPMVEYYRSKPWPWDQTVEGAPYEYGGKDTPEQARTWMATGLKPIGLWYCDAWCLSWVGCVDCAGLVCYATAATRQWSTKEMLADARQAQGYYAVYKCRTHGVEDTHWSDYQEPRKGDIVVKADHHCVLVVEVYAHSMAVIEASSDEATAIDWITLYDYQVLLQNDWRAISVRRLMDNPDVEFVGVTAEVVAGEGVVRWVTALERGTWGFAVGWSANEQGPFEQVGDYLMPKGSEDGREAKYQVGVPRDAGWVKVFEVSKDTQRVAETEAVRLR